MDKLHIRDCYAQLRSIRRLICQLTDDIGDLAATGHVDISVREEFATMSDSITDIESKLHGYQARLLALSHGDK